MTQSQLYTALKSLGYPVAYGVFDKPQTPPYILYLREDDDSVKADNTTYHSFKNYKIELYVKKKNPTLETAIETMFKQHDIEFDVSETYIDSEKLFMIIYNITI